MVKKAMKACVKLLSCHADRKTPQKEHACMREREGEREVGGGGEERGRDLQDKLEGHELTILLFDKEVEDASLSELM